MARDRNRDNKFDILSLHFIPVLIVAGALLILGTYSYRQAQKEVQQTRNEFVDRRANLAEITVKQHVNIQMISQARPVDDILHGSEFFENIFLRTDENFNLQIYRDNNGESDELLYAHFPEEGFEWVRTDAINIEGTVLTFRFGVKPELVPESIRNRPRSVISGTIIFGFIVCALVYLLLQRRSRTLKERRDRDIQRAKDNMLSLASHQLRTPATGVKQYVGMILEGFAGKISKEQRDILKRAYDSNERQLRIINEFLYLAKADADRIILTPQRFDLINFTKQIVEDMTQEINEQGHTLQLKHGASSLNCVADMHSARMIIENLISNAIKYTPSGGNITVTLKQRGRYALVIVADNGVGIARKDFPRLFRQFSRIPNSLSRHNPGSGIGLFLANYLARANHGTIEVESELGVGSTFTASLPRRYVKNLTESIRERF